MNEDANCIQKLQSNTCASLQNKRHGYINYSQTQGVNFLKQFGFPITSAGHKRKHPEHLYET